MFFCSLNCIRMKRSIGWNVRAKRFLINICYLSFLFVPTNKIYGKRIYLAWFFINRSELLIFISCLGELNMMAQCACKCVHVCVYVFCWFRELLIKLATKHYHVSQFCWFELVDWCQHSEHRCYWEWESVSIQLQNILFDNNISIELLFPFIITHFIFIFSINQTYCQ